MDKESKKFYQYTKRFVSWVTFFAIIWITWSYVLATLQFLSTGMTDMLESLSSNVCTVIMGTALGYMAKSFVETYFERKSNLAEQKYNDMMNVINNADISPDQIMGVYEKIK